MTDTGKRHHLSGRVKHHGVPVVGASIKIYPSYRSLYGEQAIYQGNTGKEGEFDFVVDPGVYKLEVDPTRNGRFLIRTIPDIEVKSNTKFSVTLATGNLVSGSVKLVSGEALKNCEVHALGIEPSSYKSSATVDENGKFSLILPDGKFHLAVRFAAANEKPRPQFYRGFNSRLSKEQTATVVSIPFVSSRLEVVTIDKDQTMDIYLPELVELSGIVENVFGQPVSQATIKITPTRAEDEVASKEFNLSTTISSGDDGRFRVLLLPSSYNLEIQPSATSSHFGILAKDLAIMSDSECKFTLEPGHKVDGKVVFEREPVADCLVRLMDRDGNRDIITRSDRMGNFAVSLPRGNYKMVVAAPPSEDSSSREDKKARLAPWSRMIVVGGDTTVDVRLEPGSQLTGKVTDDKGQPRAGILLSIFMDAGEKPQIRPVDIDSAMSRTTTDSTGHYSIMLSPGSYWILVHKDFENLRRVTIDREPQELDITWQGWCQVHFEVTSESGEKIPRCQVKYRFYGDENDVQEKPGKISGHVTTSEDGTCQITLPKGVYTFDFEPPADGSYEPRQIRQLSINADMTRKIWLSAKV